MNDLYETQGHYSYYLHCGELVVIQPSTGDWACNNPKCKYYHGAVFEKEYINWYKENR